MSEPLYVFETVLSNGTCVVGGAGLPHDDMANLKTFYATKVTRIVPAPDNTPRLDVMTPVSPKHIE